MGAGFNGGEPAFAHLLMRAYFDAARALGRSAAVLFVDLTTAFASVQRELAFSSGDVPTAALARLQEIGWTESDLRDVRDVFTEVVWRSASEGNWEAAVAEKCHDFSWATVEGSSAAVRTRRGVQAGLPIADLVFSCAMCKVLVVIRRKLAAAELITSCDMEWVKPAWKTLLRVNEPATCHLRDVSYVDDCAFPIIGSAGELGEKICRVLSIVHETFSAFKLTVNTRRGKRRPLLFLADGERRRSSGACSLEMAGYSTTPIRWGFDRLWPRCIPINIWEHYIRQSPQGQR